MSPMRHILGPCAGVLAAVLAVPLAGPLGGVHAAAPEPVPATAIKPGALERGAQISIPHVRRRTIVDGDVRVTVGAPYLRLLGKAGSDYVVHVANADGSSNSRIQRVSVAGERTKLLRGVDGQSVRISTDGGRLASAYVVKGDQTVLKVWSAATGLLQTKRSFDGVLSILDFAGRRMILGGSGPARTVAWDVVANETDQVVPQQGYAASIAGNRLATFTDDPYSGGCSIITKLTEPKTGLWASCRQRVERFSPTGRRMATVALLSDGIGPKVVRVLASRGRPLAKYTVDGWFGQLRWEDDTRLLLDANGRQQFAVVRCDRADCERATRLTPAESPRLQSSPP